MRNALLCFVDLSMCKLTHKLSKARKALSLWVIRRSLNIDKIHKNKKSFLYNFQACED